MENEKAVPLVNGGKDEKSEMIDSVPATPERQPCLAGVDRPAGRHQGYDDVDKRQLSSSSASMSKNGANNYDKNAKFGARVEEKLKRRTGLSRFGLFIAAFILVLLLIFLIVIIVLATTWPRVPHAHLFPVCKKSACLQASAQVLSMMESDAEPCDDFWSYACGRWLEEEPLRSSRTHWSLEDKQAFEHLEHLRNLVTTLPFPVDDRNTSWKIHYLYETCMRVDTIDTDGTRPLSKLIQETGGWKILRDFSEYSWDMQRAMRKLFARHGVSPFFKIDVVPDPQNPAQNMIQIVPSGLDLPDKSYYYRSPDSSVPRAFMQFMKDVVMILGAQSIDADSFSEHMFFYQRRISEVTPDYEELVDPLASMHRVTLGSLNLNAASVPLLDILQTMFPKAGIQQNTEILVPSSMYLTKVSNILTTSDRGPLSNYLVWELVLSYLPYLSKEFRGVEHRYQQVLTGIEKPKERWEMCMSTLQNYMGVALAALSEQTHKEQKDLIKQEVNQIFDRIRDALRSNVAEATWLDKDLQEHMLQKINEVSLQIGLPSTLMTEEYLSKYYEQLHIVRNDFFQNILTAKDFQLNHMNRKLVEPQEEYMWIDIASNGRRVTYVPTINKIIVPHWLLTPPLFHAEYPLSINYGGLGVQIAYALVSSIVPWNVLYNAEGILIHDNNTLANKSEASMKFATAFIARMLEESHGVSQAFANQTALSTLIHISAIRQAHMALLESLNHLPHVHQPGMESYENDQLFFLTLAQNMCSKATYQQIDIDVTTSRHLNGSLLLPTALKELKEFSEAFMCPSSSKNYALLSNMF